MRQLARLRQSAVFSAFVVTIFASATLLFLLQPIFAKMILPRLGGSAGVWTTCVLAYQLLLLGGYLYADLLRRVPRARHQAIIHLILCIVAAGCLPLQLRAGEAPVTEGQSILWVLATLIVSIGVPFFTLSTTNPLLQSWYARRFPDSNPYMLYAASNLGSLSALLLYPFAIEPIFGLHQQSQWWSAAFYCFVVLLVICASVSIFQLKDSAPEVEAVVDESDRLSWRVRARWVALAALPSSLMLGVTTFFSDLVAPIPLFWTLPLCIYLLSFVVVFARRTSVVPLVRNFAVYACMPALFAMFSPAIIALPLACLMYLAPLAIIALLCHGLLADSRPAPKHLTTFYLDLAIGGAIGGIFNSIVGPLIFHQIIEFQIVLLVACCAVLPKLHKPQKIISILNIIVPVLGISLIALALNCLHLVHDTELTLTFVTLFFFSLCFANRFKQPFIVTSIVALVLALIGFAPDRSLAQHYERNFYGVKLLELAPSAHFLLQGTTLHGAEIFMDGKRNVPTVYYNHQGPLGDIYNAVNTPNLAIAAVGVGVGTVACYRHDHQTMALYDIDPAIFAIATNPKYFTFIHDCSPNAQVVIGDGRRAIEQVANHSYGLIIFDAYAADAIPTHLLTREALAIYAQKLRPDGIMAFHITNRHVNFLPLLTALAQDGHLFLRYRKDDAAGSKSVEHVHSEWVAIASSERVIRTLPVPQWQSSKEASRVWTDDYTSLLPLLRF
jgi:hypothetical protein